MFHGHCKRRRFVSIHLTQITIPLHFSALSGSIPKCQRQHFDFSFFFKFSEDNRVAPWVAVGKMCRMTLPRVLGDVTMTSMAPSGSLRHPEPTPQNCHPPLTNRRRPKTSPTKPNATPLKLLQTPNCFTWLQKELILSNNKAV